MIRSEREISTLMALMPDLENQFPLRLRFPPFTNEELAEIFLKFVQEQQHYIADSPGVTANEAIQVAILRATELRDDVSAGGWEGGGKGK